MLNIKDPETHRLARELAELEQTTLTEAVTGALRAALAEHGHERARRRRVMEGLIAQARAQGTPEAGSAFDEFYDEVTGLPQ